jgi:hypothetical protein
MTELEGGFSRRAVAWLLGLTLGGLALAALLAVFGRDLAGGRPSPGTNTFSHSALGHRGLAELLRSLSLGVVSRRNSIEGAPGPLRPLVLAEPLTDGAAAQARLRDRLLEAAGRGAPLVVVLPKWEGAPDPGHPGWIAAAALRPPAEIQRVLRALELAGLGTVRVDRQGRGRQECAARFGGEYAVFRVDLRPAQVLVPSAGLDPVVVCGGSLLVARVTAAPFVFLVSDPDLLNNQGLGRADHAVLIHSLLTVGLRARGVIFDETVHGLNRRAGLLAEAFRFPLVFAVLQTAILAGLIVWAGLGRFGKPLPARGGPGDGTAVLIDNTAQLLAMGMHGGHAAESLARYYRQTLRSVAAAYFLPPDLPPDELLDRLQQLTGARGPRMQLHGFAERVGQVAAAGAAAGDRAVRLARILHRWRLEMTDERSRRMDGHREHP